MPVAEVRVDPEGKPYGWSFVCSECGTVYVREECFEPDEDHCERVMLAHLIEDHAAGTKATYTAGDDNNAGYPPRDAARGLPCIRPPERRPE